MSYLLTLLPELMTLKLLENNIITISLIIINIISVIFINIAYIPIINIISYVCIICLINIYLLIINIITTIYNLLVKPWQPYLISKTQNINDLKIELEYKNKRIRDQVLILVNNNKDINDLIIKIEDKNKIIHNQRLTLINKNKDINDLKIKLDEKNKNDETNKCSICLDNTISYCCSPCGHTYCSDCIKKTNNCHICRGIIHNKIKIYL